jgi:RNA polymerase sigma factor (sigma-70 family)
MHRPTADRRREGGVAVALLARHERSLRRTARRWSLCADDADDALQRAIEILLARTSSGREPERLAAWMHVVVRHEALAVRRDRERMLADAGGDAGAGDIDRLPSQRLDPAECTEHRERFEVAARLLAELKPAERLAIVLQACGYSYTEIAAACGWTYTKVNRSLSEGRAKLRGSAPETA